MHGWWRRTFIQKGDGAPVGFEQDRLILAKASGGLPDVQDGWNAGFAEQDGRMTEFAAEFGNDPAESGEDEGPRGFEGADHQDRRLGKVCAGEELRQGVRPNDRPAGRRPR